MGGNLEPVDKRVRAASMNERADLQDAVTSRRNAPSVKRTTHTPRAATGLRATERPPPGREVSGCGMAGPGGEAPSEPRHPLNRSTDCDGTGCPTDIPGARSREGRMAEKVRRDHVPEF